MFCGSKQQKNIVRAIANLVAIIFLWWCVPSYAFAPVPKKPKPQSALKNGLTQTPDAALQKKIAARETAAKNNPADVRVLSAQEMSHIAGRGALRNKSFSGTLPWHRSLRDVNLCTGNLFKSFTDIQVAPGRGAGLVLQRTYNSNDERVGPFGVGWTHAYDIRMEEDPQPVDGDTQEFAARTDFFGGKHKYKRDADGLYSPPPYLFDETNSKYGDFLANGPQEVLEDIEKRHGRHGQALREEGVWA